MNSAIRFAPSPRLAAGTIAIALVGASAFAVTPRNAHVAPAIATRGTDLGRESGETSLKLTVWMNVHNKADLDAKVRDLYTQGSPTFHQWMKTEQLRPYMPTAEEVTVVRRELEAYNIKVSKVDPTNLFLSIEGKTSDIERAFQTTIHKTSLKNVPGAHGREQLIHTTSAFPRLRGEAGEMMFHLGGVDAARPVPHAVRPVNPKTKQEYGGVKLVKGKPAGLYFADQCFYDPTTLNVTGVSAADGTTPVTVSYAGLSYGADPANTDQGTLPPCGYSPSQVYNFYGLNSAYSDGIAGDGQTIVIVDAYNEPSSLTNLAAFSSLYSLPAQTTGNFTVYNPDGVGLLGIDYGWDEETDLDLEWSHAIAPNANTAFVQAYSDDIENLQHAVYYAVENNLGSTISGSFGLPESYQGPYITQTWDLIGELGASKGINLDFSSGDDGDFVADGLNADVSTPASSAYVTAIGGTSIGVDPSSGGVYTVGWGNNIAFLDEGSDGTNDYLDDPPAAEFYAGSGGGSSTYINKPAYQSKLAGTTRQVPDVSALADPYTGAEFVYDDGAGDQYVGVIGGTSLAAPIFSGMWALANQVYGSSLGQAGPTVSVLPSSIIQDVVPLSTPYNVTGTITDGSGATYYTAAQISLTTGSADPVFASAIYNLGSDEYVNLTFGTDSSLVTAKGWDNVTGYGTPNIAGYFQGSTIDNRPIK